MFGLRLTIDCQPRAKNGAPPHSTTGVASASWTHGSRSSIASRAPRRPQRRAHAEAARHVGELFVLGSSAVISTGSSAMPQIGHDPGPICRTSGCIGQVYSTSALTAVALVGPSEGGYVTDLQADLKVRLYVRSRYFAGSAWNLARQPPQQK
jgi:hypothetical protein